jgi:hypothetical protein
MLGERTGRHGGSVTRENRSRRPGGPDFEGDIRDSGSYFLAVLF